MSYIIIYQTLIYYFEIKYMKSFNLQYLFQPTIVAFRSFGK